MLRLRLPGGIVSSYQARGLADVAERFGGGTIDLTTRANLQIREIGAGDPIEVLTAIDELGLTSRGAGADNIRNLTGSATAGIDRQELIDTRPLTRALYHHILNHRELYGLPRKFNISFDGGGRIAMLEDTADMGFAAVRVGREKPIADTAFTYKNKPVNAKQIGRDLGVRYVLEGSVQRSGNQVRVNAQLIDAETDAHLWAERFDREWATCSPCKTRLPAGSQTRSTSSWLAWRLPDRPSIPTRWTTFFPDALCFSGSRRRVKILRRQSASSSMRWSSIRDPSRQRPIWWAYW
jgi:hypothetical protein